MAQGIINIIAKTPPPVGSSGSTNVIPLNYYDPVKLRDIEFDYRGMVTDVFSSIGLTWRDFTIDCTPFDHRYTELANVEVMGYGILQDISNIKTEVPFNNNPLLYNQWTGNPIVSTPFVVGSMLGYSYKPNNIYETFNPAKIREWQDDDVKAFIIPSVKYPIDGQSKVFYIKTRNIYVDGTKSDVNTLYVYRSEYPNDPNYKPGLKYKQYPTSEPPALSWLELELLPNSVEVLTSDKMFRMFEFKYENFKNPVNSSPLINFTDVINLSQLQQLLESMYPHLYDYGNAGFPLKLTIWDMNYGNNPGPSQSRFIVNGAPMENGMGIPFQYFDEGKVVFITDGLPEGGKYNIFFSIMDVVSGYVRARGDS